MAVSKEIQKRMNWMKDNPDKQYATCVKCGERKLVYDPKKPYVGFKVDVSRYNKNHKPYMVKKCRVCIMDEAVARKRENKIKAKGVINVPKGKSLPVLESDCDKLVNSSKICLRCDRIQSGKNKVCKVCGKADMFSNGNEVGRVKGFQSMLTKSDRKKLTKQGK